MNTKNRKIGKIELIQQLVRHTYSRVPAMECKGKCQASCGVIPVFPVEQEMIEAAGQKPPSFQDHNLTCSALKNGRCSIYENRPLICRLWGSVEEMPCPWGCKPKKLLTEPESFRLLNALEKLSGGREPVVLQDQPSVLLKEPIYFPPIPMSYFAK